MCNNKINEPTSIEVSNNQIQKQYKKLFRKEHNKYIKELVNLVKKDTEFSWGYIVDTLLFMLKRRYEYYSKGYNVWQATECRAKVIETLKEAIDKLTLAIEVDEKLPEIPEGGWTVEALRTYEETVQKTWDDAFLSISTNIRLWWD